MMSAPTQSSPLAIPPLESGDRLNCYEFERRYATMPHLKKAELVEGVVYMPAALRFRSHGQPHGHLNDLAWRLREHHSRRSPGR